MRRNYSPTLSLMSCDLLEFISELVKYKSPQSSQRMQSAAAVIFAPSAFCYEKQQDVEHGGHAIMRWSSFTSILHFQVKDSRERLERGCTHMEPASLLTGMWRVCSIVIKKGKKNPKDSDFNMKSKLFIIFWFYKPQSAQRTQRNIRLCALSVLCGWLSFIWLIYQNLIWKVTEIRLPCLLIFI